MYTTRLSYLLSVAFWLQPLLVLQVVQCSTLRNNHLITSEDHQHFHHGDRTDNHEDDVHEDPSYDMIHIWYNPVDNGIKH